MPSIEVHGRNYELVSQTELTFGDLKKVERIGQESGRWGSIEEWLAASAKADPLATQAYLWLCVIHSDPSVTLDDLDDVPLSALAVKAPPAPKPKARKGRTVTPKVDPTGTA